jgi:thioesterase domain-containing protein
LDKLWETSIYHLAVASNACGDLDPKAFAKAFHQALREYVPQLYPGRAILFHARDQGIGVEEDPQCGWGGMMADGLEIYEVPGDHISMLQEPHVRALAKQLGACLSKAQASEGFVRALPPTLKHD